MREFFYCYFIDFQKINQLKLLYIHIYREIKIIPKWFYC